MSTTIRLKCLIEGETIVFPVTAACDDEVSDLKEFIQSKRALGSLKDIDPHTRIVEGERHRRTRHVKCHGFS